MELRLKLNKIIVIIYICSKYSIKCKRIDKFAPNFVNINKFIKFHYAMNKIFLLAVK